MKILERYILKENSGPFIVSLVVTTFVMLMDKILDLLNLIIDKKLDIVTILSIFGLSLPFMFALTVPMAVLLASIMSFGRLSTDSELVAFKSCGINIYTLLKPTVIAAAILSVFMVFFNNEILPETNHMLKNMTIKASYRRPITEIVPGAFNQLKEQTIYAKERVGEELRGILIYNTEESKYPQSITAERGFINLSDGGNSVEIILQNGQIHERDKKDGDKYQITSFKQFKLNLPDLGYRINEEGTSSRSDRELSSKAMLEIIRNNEKNLSEIESDLNNIKLNIETITADSLIKDVESARRIQGNKKKLKTLESEQKISEDKVRRIKRDINKYEVEIHKKYAIAFACLIFVLIGAPIGMMTKTSGVGMAFSVSSIVFMIYYGALTLGEEFADKGVISPFLAMWISNIIFAIIGIWLVLMSMKETKFIDLKGFMNKILELLRLK